MNTVSVLDSEFGLTKNIFVGIRPQGIAVDAFSNKVYVANYGADSVSVINSINDTKEATI